MNIMIKTITDEGIFRPTSLSNDSNGQQISERSSLWLARSLSASKSTLKSLEPNPFLPRAEDSFQVTPQPP